MDDQFAPPSKLAGGEPQGDPRLLALLGTVAVLVVVSALAAVLLTTSNRSRDSVEEVREAIDVPLARIDETLDASIAGEAELQLAAATTGAARTQHLEASIAAGEAAAQAWTRYQAVAFPLAGEAALAARYERGSAAGKQIAADAIVPILQGDRPMSLAPEQTQAAARNAANLRALRSRYQRSRDATLEELSVRMEATGRRIRIGAAGCLVLVGVAGIAAARSASRTVRSRRVRADAAKLTAFETQMVRGLELLEDDEQVVAAAARALALASPASAVGVRAVDHGPSAGGSLQCGLPSTDRCPAVRAGAPMRFEDSAAMDACPYLADAPPCSATCLPISIAGRSAGVAQLVGPVGSSPAPDGAVQVVVRRVGERITMMRAIARFELQASRDPLTGLINRRSLEGAVADLRESGTDYAVAFADLDHFKRLNDRYGHQAGDRALCDFASTLASGLRAVDLACRWGGEEFVMVLPGCDVREATEAMERVRSMLALDALSDGRSPVTASIGVAVRLAGETFDETVARADEALITAKTSGRNRVVPWTPVSPPRVEPTPQPAR